MKMNISPNIGHQVEVPHTPHLRPLCIRIGSQHSDSAILVNTVEADPALPLGLPHLLNQVTAPPSQLEVQVEVGRGELGIGVLVLAGKEAGSQLLSEVPTNTKLLDFCCQQFLYMFG